MSYPADISDDVSTGVTYTAYVEIDNSRLTKRERKAAHEIIRRHVAALSVQLTMLMEGKVEMALQRSSTTSGSLIMDLGVQTDE